MPLILLVLSLGYLMIMGLPTGPDTSPMLGWYHSMVIYGAVFIVGALLVTGRR